MTAKTPSAMADAVERLKKKAARKARDKVEQLGIYRVEVCERWRLVVRYDSYRLKNPTDGRTPGARIAGAARVKRERQMGRDLVWDLRRASITEPLGGPCWLVETFERRNRKPIVRQTANVDLIPARIVVQFTRIAPGAFDDDNMTISAKRLRDGVADALGIDDRDARVRWLTGQEKAPRGVYAVRIEVRGE